MTTRYAISAESQGEPGTRLVHFTCSAEVLLCRLKGNTSREHAARIYTCVFLPFFSRTLKQNSEPFVFVRGNGITWQCAKIHRDGGEREGDSFHENMRKLPRQLWGNDCEPKSLDLSRDPILFLFNWYASRPPIVIRSYRAGYTEATRLFFALCGSGYFARQVTRVISPILRSYAVRDFQLVIYQFVDISIDDWR